MTKRFIFESVIVEISISSTSGGTLSDAVLSIAKSDLCTEYVLVSASAPGKYAPSVTNISYVYSPSSRPFIPKPPEKALFISYSFEFTFVS